MGIRKGDIVVSSSGYEGIVLDFRYSECNSYYHKAVVYCTLAPEYGFGKVNTVFEINTNYLKRKK